ncbi:MAG: hypothetical protein J0M35_18035 [Candidatus Obscuribacter phosphatis]|uniref:Uncharacterized protein n=1 Tax=Candidatus Obscuribacter phosphatis TaxID=1906157 RepID=A0A8J7TMK5_9BACT|nr:hypothetical protein [Candidatus Obscuribacter phosphatis]
MLPAYLFRVGIDWVRHQKEFANSNPYARCEHTIKVLERLFEENLCGADSKHLEVASVCAYWEEFFHLEDPLQDEKEWIEGLTKRSSQYDNFEKWQEWFKTSYAKVFSENNIWTSLLMTSWATTHQYQLVYTEDSWDFVPSRSYLPTSQMWRLSRHLDTVTEVLREFWIEESRRWEESGFLVQDESSHYLGRVECLGFDTRKYTVTWPSRSHIAKNGGIHKQVLDLGSLVADIVAPVGDNWYRRPDSVIFAHDHIDVTSLINRATYVFGSKRRVFELALEDDFDKARLQAQAEGWLVEELELAE